ncbi:MAG: nucleotide-binding protein [Casimicrobiaceae bacterium]
MKALLIALVATFGTHVAWAAGDVAPPAAPSLKGEVLEVQDVAAYTYLRLKTANGETWAAVNKSAVKKGAKVTIDNPMVMENFESKSLHRTFDTIVFGTLAGTSVAADPHMLPGASPIGPDFHQIHGGGATTPDVGTVKVAKADGASGRTVAEVNADRLALKDQRVTIRAKVVKVTANVMGKNWVHLRDGSGSAADSSNEILATSTDQPKVGDVVIAKGVVRTDVNLGYGYVYKVLVEDVSFKK